MSNTKIQENNNKLNELLNIVNSLPNIASSSIDSSGITDWSYFSPNNSRNKLISSMDTSDGLNFDSMCEGSTELKSEDIINLDLTNAETADSIFRDCTSLISIPTTLNPAKITNFRRMFRGCSGLTEIPHVDISNAESLEDYLRGCSNITDFSYLGNNVNTSTCKCFDATFMDCTGMTKVPNIDTSSGTEFQYMFCGTSLNDSTNSNITLNTDNGINFNYMFSNINTGSNYGVLPKLSSTSKGESFAYMYYKTTIFGRPSIDTANGKNLVYMFAECKMDSGDFVYNLKNAEDCQSMFFNSNLFGTSGNCDTDFLITGITKKCKNTKHMFHGANEGFTTFPESAGDLSGVTDASYMFYGCNELQTVYIDLTSCENAGLMFGDCSALKNLYLSGTLSTSINLQNCPLTKYSCHNVINKLTNFNGTNQVYTKYVYMDPALLNAGRLTGYSALPERFNSAQTIHFADEAFVEANQTQINAGTVIVNPTGYAYGNSVVVKPGAEYNVIFNVQEAGVYELCISHYVTQDAWDTVHDYVHSSKVRIDGVDTGLVCELSEHDTTNLKPRSINYFTGILLEFDVGIHSINLVGNRQYGLTAYFNDAYLRKLNTNESIDDFEDRVFTKYNNQWLTWDKVIEAKGWNH